MMMATPMMVMVTMVEWKSGVEKNVESVGVTCETVQH